MRVLTDASQQRHDQISRLIYNIVISKRDMLSVFLRSIKNANKNVLDISF